MSKRYDQYCPVAHALGLVGERWSLLIVRELLHGPKRYTDLSASLPGIGSNILSARLKELENAGLVTKRRLEPPYASQVYELTEYGLGLKPVMRELALWGLRTIGPPTDDDELAPGWLYGALDTVFAPVAPAGSFEFRIAGETAALVDGEPRRGPVDAPDVVVASDKVEGFYRLFVERRLEGVTIRGDRERLERLLEAATLSQDAPVAA
ncbi:MAG TPA: helix-turn-helix domain-containing protein [Gaiellaceae bacterium]|nr:helix-turn-helix domain-containing protein [Gaiellaceae bacterium]